MKQGTHSLGLSDPYNEGVDKQAHCQVSVDVVGSEAYMTRRHILRALVGATVPIVFPRSSHGEKQTAPETYTYKTAGGCAIKADVYGAETSVRKPVIIWIHGGGLISGSREIPPKWLDPEGRSVIVSIDYRLAPETKLPAIIEDLQSAYGWVREQGPKLFGIDLERMAVAGQSAGGYLTLMAGFCVTPRPKALLSLSGYGDITSPWYSRPSPFYLRQRLVSKEDAYRSVGTACVCEPPKTGHRGTFYLYCRQQGIWPKEITDHDPDSEPKWFDPYCPARNVSAKYPPTVLIHGTADTDVPYEESARMDEQLSRFGIDHKFLRVPGGSHCLFEDAPTVKDPVFRQAAEFVKNHTS